VKEQKDLKVITAKCATASNLNSFVEKRIISLQRRVIPREQRVELKLIKKDIFEEYSEMEGLHRQLSPEPKQKST